MTEHVSSSHPGFAFYRLPDEDAVNVVSGRATPIGSLDEVGARTGFLIAPFAVSDSCPLLFIDDEGKSATPLFHFSTPDSSNSRDDYAGDFSRFHSALLGGGYEKLVLARSVSAESRRSPEEMFREACRRYPQCFVVLFSTPQSGTWLVATPERLLQGEGGEWHTMALAGTMPAGSADLWSEKNLREQRLVAEFIREKLCAFSSDIREEDPLTVAAGAVQHLRSDFFFSAPATAARAIAAALHPTPAVAGLPRDEARDFILKEEHCQRRYYSGFAGPVAPNALSLFVTLRCMQLSADGALLYAGGGILAESQEQAEWNETEAKLQTMRQIL